MSLSKFIRNCRESKAYFRGMVIRAIEDAILVFCLGLMIWALCAFAEAVLGSMGVL